MSTWRNKNAGKSPFDPDYDDSYDPEKDFEAYCEHLEEKEED